MLFFYKLVQETQMSTPLEATRCHNLTKLLILLPLRDNSKSTFQCETPCIRTILKSFYQILLTWSKTYLCKHKMGHIDIHLWQMLSISYFPNLFYVDRLFHILSSLWLHHHHNNCSSKLLRFKVGD